MYLGVRGRVLPPSRARTERSEPRRARVAQGVCVHGSPSDSTMFDKLSRRGAVDH